MSVLVCLVSETRLTQALYWGARLAEAHGTTLKIAVRGQGRDAFVEMVRKRSQQQDITAEVVTVKDDPAAICTAIANETKPICLFPYDHGEDSIAFKVVQRTTASVVWLGTPAGEITPPTRIRIAWSTLDGKTESLCDTLAEKWQARRVPLPWHSRHAGGQDAEALAPDDVLILPAVTKDTDPQQAELTCEWLSTPPAGATVLAMQSATGIAGSLPRLLDRLFNSIADPMRREDRLALSKDLQQGSQLQLEFVALICASTILAAFGLVQNSAAVIIGAMLIAPLMTPILGAGMALAHGNQPLFLAAWRTILIGVLAALVTSALFGLWIRLVDSSNITSEMWSRSHPSVIDFFVGFVGGSAAAYARTRGHLSSALAGAAIAAALVPPIATAGLAIAFSPQSSTTQDPFPISGPLLLLAANVITIMIGSSIVLWARGIRSDHQHSGPSRWSARTLALLITLATLAAIELFLHH